MGICGSRVLDLSLLEGSKDVQALLCLEDAEVLRLSHGFHRAVLTGNARLSFEEWQLWMRFDDTDLSVARRLFDSYADDAAGLSFRTFLCFTWNVAARDTTAIASLSFDLYDQRGHGIIDARDLKVVMADVFGEGWAANHAAVRVFTSLGGGGDLASAAQIRRDEWLLRLSKSPILLLPLFQFQATLQQRTGGTRFWARIEARRRALSDSQQLNLDAIVDLVNRARVSKVAAARRASLTAQKPGVGVSRRLSDGSAAAAAAAAALSASAPAPQSMLTFSAQHFIVSPRQAATSSEAGVKMPPVSPTNSNGRRTSLTGFVMPPIVIPRSPLEKVGDALAAVGGALVRPLTGPILRARDEYEGLIPGEPPKWTAGVGPLLGWVRATSGEGAILMAGAGLSSTPASASADKTPASASGSTSESSLYMSRAPEPNPPATPGAASTGLASNSDEAGGVRPVRRASMSTPRRESVARRASLSQGLPTGAGSSLSVGPVRKTSLSDGAALEGIAGLAGGERRASLTLQGLDTPARTGGGSSSTPGGSLFLTGAATPASPAGSSLEMSSKPASVASYDPTTAGLLGALAATSPGSQQQRASRRRSSAGDSTSIMMGAIGRTSAVASRGGVSHHSTESVSGGGPHSTHPPR